jgi:hypothetical protein
MPSSEAPPARGANGVVDVVVLAPMAATEIAVVDANLQTVASGPGYVRAQLRPGIYKITYRAGAAMTESFQLVRPGSDPIHVAGPDLPFPSAAPLAGIGTIREYHQAAAAQWSRPPGRPFGASSLFVFVRDFTPPGFTPPTSTESPAAGLRLYDDAGNLVHDLGEASNVRAQPGEDPCAGRAFALPPGAYRLQVDAGPLGPLQQLVWVADGWQTQVFAMRRAYEVRGAGVLRADLANASIMMREGGFSATDDHGRLADLARIGLANRRAVLSPQGLRDIAQMVNLKGYDPMLGIYAGHLMLASDDPDRALLGVMIKNLTDLVGRHPDVDALRLAITDPAPPDLSFLLPPMLQHSWQIVVDRSAKAPGLVPATSLSARIAKDLWGDSAWLLWRKERPQGATDFEHHPFAEDAEFVLDLLAKDPSPTPGENLDGYEQALLGILRGLAADRTPGDPPFTIDDAVSRLRLPRASAQATMASLADKLDPAKTPG